MKKKRRANRIGRRDRANYYFSSPYAATPPCLSAFPEKEGKTNHGYPVVGVAVSEKNQGRVIGVCGACAVLGVRVVPAARLKLIPLVGARPGHAKRVVLAKLSRGRICQAGGARANQSGPMVVPRGFP